MKQQLQDYLDGKPPLDFCHNDCAGEKHFEGFQGEAMLSGEGRRAMGFDL